MSTSTLSGFTPLRVVYPSSSSSSSTHILYVRAHSESTKKKKSRKGKEAVSPSFPHGRTLFLVNVPPDATERELVVFFRDAGIVENVMFDGEGEQVGDVEEDEEESSGAEEEGGDEEGGANEEEADEGDTQPRKKRKRGKGAMKPSPPEVKPLPARPTRTFRKPGGTAHVVFTDESSIPRALSLSKKDRPWPIDQTSPIGLTHYATLYASLRPPLDVVKAHADSWMELFDYEQAKKKQESKFRKGEAIVDDDGFTLVTRGGAYGQTLGGGVGVASKKFQEGAGRGGGASKRHRSKKKEPLEKDSFYAFQIHEKKRNDLIELKRKWEEDKAKVEKMKSSRKYRPY